MATEQLAARIVRAMEAKNYKIDRGAGEVNIIYPEGVTFKDVGGTLTAEANGNKANLWNDVRAVLQFVNGAAVITDWWQATTEPGTRYTMTPINEAGAARITLGQQKCWQVGTHRGYEALAQWGDAVMVTRDKNKDYGRVGDKVTKGMYGINQHHGHDADVNNIGPNSAGCLVGRTVKGHREFMLLVKTDPRYIANKKFVYATTILEASEVIIGAAIMVPSRPNAAAPAKMILKLTPAAVAKCFAGKAPAAIVDAFVEDQASLAKAGILDTPERLADCFANLAHEVNDFTIKGLTENINYSHAGAATTWKSRFPGGPAAVVAKYGSAPGWQRKMLDDVYGNRMGNRPGTNDGSEFIGRSGTQITGRDGYREVGKRAGLDLENDPDLAALPENQPAIVAAFWAWKNMNAAPTFLARVKLWNGGTNGLADREARRARILPIAKSLERVPFLPETVTATVVIAAGGGAVAHQANKPDSNWASIAFIAGAVFVVAVLAFVIIRSMRKQ